MRPALFARRGRIALAMSKESVELVRAWVDVWSGRELVRAMQDPAFAEAALQPMTPDFELRWAEENPDVQTYRGHDGVLAAMSEWLEPWEEYRQDAIEFIDAGENVVVTYTQVGLGRGSGATTEMNVSHVYAIRDGEIASLREFVSRDAALEAAGVKG